MEQCNQAVRFDQHETNSETNYGSFKEEIKNQYQSFKSQMGKLPLGTTSVITIMPDVAFDNTCNNVGRNLQQYV